MLTDQDSRDPLNWLSAILWPDRSTVIGQDGSSEPTWWASPSVDKPKILIPARSMAAARTSVKRYHDGFSPALRARSLTAEALMLCDPLARRLLANKGVGIHPVAGPEGGTGTAADDGGSAVLDGIRDLMGLAELHVAISLSTPKSNQKPVLQLLDGTGRCVGWAKVAWNDRTEVLVGNEAQWLQRRPRPPLSMPSLLHDVEIAGRRVVIGSGVEPSRRPRRVPSGLPTPDVFLAVAELGTANRVDIRQSPWWGSVERVLDVAGPREREAITTAIAACNGRRFRIGAWHGDLTPWNLMTTAKRVHLIDWEFAADGVPVGFDLCHFHTQVASEMKPRTNDSPDAGARAAAALDHSARLSPQGLAALGVEPENRLPVWRLYLVELIRRSLVLRANGYPADLIAHGPAALRRLERALGCSITGSGPSSTDRRKPVEPAGDTKRRADDSPTDDDRPKNTRRADDDRPKNKRLADHDRPETNRRADHDRPETNRRADDLSTRYERAEDDRADDERADGDRADGDRADGDRADGDRADGERADGDRADDSPGDNGRFTGRRPASLETRSDIGQAIAEDIGMGFTIGRRDNGAGVR